MQELAHILEKLMGKIHEENYYIALVLTCVFKLHITQEKLSLIRDKYLFTVSYNSKGVVRLIDPEGYGCTDDWSYMKLISFTDAEELLTAYRARAAYMRKTLKYD